MEVLVKDRLRDCRIEDLPGLIAPPLLPLFESRVSLHFGGSMTMYVALPFDVDRYRWGEEKDPEKRRMKFMNQIALWARKSLHSVFQCFSLGYPFSYNLMCYRLRESSRIRSSEHDGGGRE